MYQLIALDKWDYDDQVILMTGELSLLKSRLKIFNQYIKHFTCCPKNRNQRKLYGNIEKKLLKELHGQSPSEYLYDLLYNHHVCILDISKQVVYCEVRLHRIIGGLVPYDHETNEDYKRETQIVKFFLENTWQKLYIKPKFKYFMIG